LENILITQWFYKLTNPFSKKIITMLTTTDTIPFKIIKILGLVKGSGSAAAMFDNNYEEVDKATNDAISEMSNRAKSVNANAVIGIKISISNGGGVGKVVLASAIGTAILYDPNQPL
jgi:uncharacterized protein YbjQ (UPF0145 family)